MAESKTLPNLRPRGLKDNDGNPILNARGKQVWGAIGGAGLAPGDRALVTRQNGSSYEVEIDSVEDEFEGDPKYGDSGLLGVYAVSRIGKDGQPVRSAFTRPAAAPAPAQGGNGPGPAALETVIKAVVVLAGLVASLAAANEDSETMDEANAIAEKLNPAPDWHAIGQKHGAAVKNAPTPEAAAEAANKAVLALAKAPPPQKKALMTVAANAGLVWDAESKVFSAPAEDTATEEEVPF